MGMAAERPGIVRAREVLGQHLAEIDEAMGQEIPPATITATIIDARPRRGKPLKALPASALKALPAPAAHRSRGWANLTAEERKVEAKRRMQVRLANRAAKAEEAKQAAKKKALQAARQRYWNSLTPAQQKAHVAKMQKGRKQQANEVQLLEAAS